MAEVLLKKHVDPQKELARLRSKSLNFDPKRRHEYTKKNGWHIDDYAVQLPSEPRGSPISNGPWEIARKLSTTYRFVDPAVLRAFYDPGHELSHRTMLLEVHFWGLRIYTGVRVGDVFDGVIEQEGRPVRAHIWSYRTLENHFEMGEISYETRKWLDSGDVDFRIHAYSRRADPKNVLVRIGFWLFGRTKQIQFANKACRRMLLLTMQSLADGEDADRVVAENPAARPDSRRTTAVQRARRIATRRASDD